LKESGFKTYLSTTCGCCRSVEKNLLHPSAQVIYKAAKRRTKGLSLSTVYYTLNELSKHGIIKTLEFDRMENRYEGNLTDHINLICKECHGITDYKIPVVIDSREVTRKSRFWVTDTRLEYYGYARSAGRNSPTTRLNPWKIGLESPKGRSLHSAIRNDSKL